MLCFPNVLKRRQINFSEVECVLKWCLTKQRSLLQLYAIKERKKNKQKKPFPSSGWQDVSILFYLNPLGRKAQYFSEERHTVAQAGFPTAVEA